MGVASILCIRAVECRVYHAWDSFILYLQLLQLISILMWAWHFFPQNDSQACSSWKFEFYSKEVLKTQRARSLKISRYMYTLLYTVLWTTVLLLWLIIGSSGTSYHAQCTGHTCDAIVVSQVIIIKLAILELDLLLSEAYIIGYVCRL